MKIEVRNEDCPRGCLSQRLRLGCDPSLPAALCHAIPRLNILMTPHYCCGVSSKAGYPGIGIQENSHSRENNTLPYQHSLPSATVVLFYTNRACVLL